MTKVCIIGAGSSGIVAAKILHQRQIPFDCFERGSGVGGMWRFNNDSGTSSAYASLHINTSRRKMQYSDYAMPDHYPDFPHHSQILDYFENYVDHFGFRDKIQFRTSVADVQPRQGGYDVTVEKADGVLDVRRYSSVVVANGHHWCPSYPHFPGTFTGTALHSHYYKTPDDLRGKRVLIVGLGNSGCDIASEVSRVAAKTYLAVRSGAHIIPKYIFGKPLDTIMPPWAWRRLPLWLMQGVFNLAMRISRGKLKRFSLPMPNHRILEEHPTISSDLLNLIGHGRIDVKPNIAALADDRVCFADETSEIIDTIIYATGYKIVFPFLDEKIINARNNEVNLYKLVVHPVCPNLFFAGLVQPWGAIMPLAELQSEWIADLLQGATTLPSQEDMQRDIDQQQQKIQQRYTRSPRHTIQVDYYPYWDALCKERGRGPARERILRMPAATNRSEAA